MDIDQGTIIGILTGSLGTIVVKGIIDFFNKSAEHKREIKRGFYGKKLASAEETIRSLFNNYQSMIVIVNAIDNLVESDMDGDFFDQIWTSYYAQMTKAEEQLLSSSASLYFQLENDELWSNEDQKELLEIYSNVKILSDEIQYLNSLIDESDDDEVKTKTEIYIEEELRAPLILEMKRLAEKLRKSYQGIFKTIESIKKEVKKGM